ncbi:MAG: LapA family protein [Burkholderiaceae bacterium]
MLRTLVLFAVLLLVGLFALLNWPAFAALTPLSFGFMTVQAPLGFIMLGAVVFLALIFTVWAIAMQASALGETRRQSRQLQAQRELADRAEASRFTELHTFLVERIDRLQTETQRSLENNANTIGAVVAELEDRLERGHLPALERTPPKLG